MRIYQTKSTQLVGSQYKVDVLRSMGDLEEGSVTVEEERLYRHDIPTRKFTKGLVKKNFFRSGLKK